MTATLRCEQNGLPALLGDLCRVTKTHGDKQLQAACRLWTHQLGWEVRLEINGDLRRSEGFRSQDEVLTAGETWKAAMLEKGWNGRAWPSCPSIEVRTMSRRSRILWFAVLALYGIGSHL